MILTAIVSFEEEREVAALLASLLDDGHATMARRAAPHRMCPHFAQKLESRDVNVHETAILVDLKV